MHWDETRTVATGTSDGGWVLNIVEILSALEPIRILVVHAIGQNDRAGAIKNERIIK